MLPAETEGMSNNLIDLSTHRIAKVRENDELRDHVSALLQCNGILSDAVEQMWDFAGRNEILTTLRRAVAIFETDEE